MTSCKLFLGAWLMVMAIYFLLFGIDQLFSYYILLTLTIAIFYQTVK